MEPPRASHPDAAATACDNNVTPIMHRTKFAGLFCIQNNCLTKQPNALRDEIGFDMQAAAVSEHTDRVIKSSDGQLFLSDNHESVLSKKSKIGRRLD